MEVAGGAFARLVVDARFGWCRRCYHQTTPAPTYVVDEGVSERSKTPRISGEAPPLYPSNKSAPAPTPWDFRKVVWVAFALRPRPITDFEASKG